MSVEDIDLGWLAGFLEGEGSFLWYRASKGGPYPRVQFITTDGDVARRAARLMGGNIVIRSKHAIPAYKDQYRSKVTGRRALDIMEQLLPHMGERRSAKIEELLESSRRRWMPP